MIEAVRNLLAQGKIHTHIAARLGIGRGVVQKVAKEILVPSYEKHYKYIDFGETDAHICKKCGAKITTKVCVACKSRKTKTIHSDPAPDEIKNAFKLDLHGDYKKRYEEMKRYRDGCKNPNFIDIPDDHPLRVGLSGVSSVVRRPVGGAKVLPAPPTAKPKAIPST